MLGGQDSPAWAHGPFAHKRVCTYKQYRVWTSGWRIKTPQNAFRVGLTVCRWGEREVGRAPGTRRRLGARDARTGRAEPSRRKPGPPPVGTRRAVFQVPTPPSGSFSCYRIISHGAFPPPVKSHADVLASPGPDGRAAEERSPVLRTCPAVSPRAVVSALPHLCPLRNGLGGAAAF